VTAQDDACTYYASVALYQVKAVCVHTVGQDKRYWVIEDNDGHAEVLKSQPTSTVHTL
jgi:hypothetical protein